MLVLTRRTHEYVPEESEVILTVRGIEIIVRLIEIRNKTSARIGITAPEDEVHVLRSELANKTGDGHAKESA